MLREKYETIALNLGKANWREGNIAVATSTQKMFVFAHLHKSCRHQTSPPSSSASIDSHNIN